MLGFAETFPHEVRTNERDALLAKTAMEILRSQAAGATQDIGTFADATAEAITGLDERLSALENMNAGSALANVRWSRMTQAERQRTLDAARTHKADDPQNPEA